MIPKNPRKGRPALFREYKVMSIKLDKQTWLRLQDLAAAESAIRGETVTTHALIRNAIEFVYDDNERLRELFRRTRIIARTRASFKALQKREKVKKKSKKDYARRLAKKSQSN